MSAAGSDTRDRCMSSFAQPMSCGSVVDKVRGTEETGTACDRLRGRAPRSHRRLAALVPPLGGARIIVRGPGRTGFTPPRQYTGLRRAYQELATGRGGEAAISSATASVGACSRRKPTRWQPRTSRCSVHARRRRGREGVVGHHPADLAPRCCWCRRGANSDPHLTYTT